MTSKLAPYESDPQCWPSLQKEVAIVCVGIETIYFVDRNGREGFVKPGFHALEQARQDPMLQIEDEGLFETIPVAIKAHLVRLQLAGVAALLSLPVPGGWRIDEPSRVFWWPRAKSTPSVTTECGGDVFRLHSRTTIALTTAAQAIKSTSQRAA